MPASAAGQFPHEQLVSPPTPTQSSHVRRGGIVVRGVGFFIVLSAVWRSGRPRGAFALVPGSHRR